MDVRLPNGQVIKNVPQGMSKADLVAKLRRNGHDMSWVDGPAQTTEPVAAMDEPVADEQSNLGAVAQNVPKLLKRSGARLVEGLTELPSAAAAGVGRLAGGASPGAAEAAFGGAIANARPSPDDPFSSIGGKTREQILADQQAWDAEHNGDPAKSVVNEITNTPIADRGASAARRAVAPVTESRPIIATREWAKSKEKEALDALTPMARRAIELSLVEHDENEGLTMGEGASDPWWWTANIIDLGVQMAPGMGATALSARMTYAGKYRQVLGELSTQKIPQSVAIKEAEKQAMKAATRSAMITGGLTEGAVGGGQNASQTREAIDSLNEETLMAYPGYMELRDQGMTHEQARQQIASDKAAAVAISTGALIGLTGAPMNAYFGKLAAKFGRVAEGTSKLERLKVAGKGALGEGAQEFVQEGGEQLIQNKAEQPITQVDTWDGVLENAITGAVLGGLVGGAADLAVSGKKGKAPAELPPGAPPAGPAPKGPVETAESAYEAASKALEQGELAARDPNVNIKYAEIQKLRDAKKKAMVDFTRELLHSGQIKEADQSAVSEALKQAEAEGISATSRKTAGGDVSPARDAALEAAANAEQLEESDANDLISNGLAKISPRGAMVLTPEGRRQRKAAQERAKAELQDDSVVKPTKPPAGPKGPPPAGQKQLDPDKVKKVITRPKMELPPAKREARAAKERKAFLEKQRPATVARTLQKQREADTLKATVQAKAGEQAQLATELAAQGAATTNPQMREAFESAAALPTNKPPRKGVPTVYPEQDTRERARRGLPINKPASTKTAAFRLKGQPETAEIPGKGKVKIEPVQAAKDASAAYRKSRGIVTPEQTEFARVEPARAKRIAKAFDEMQHAPNDPTVKRAYRAMIDETKAQWQEIKKTGLKVEFIKPGQADPYAKSPREAIEDVRNNNHLWVFPTDSGFGTDSKYSKDNPMLEDSGEKVGDHQLKNNDVFRVVHDYFGHVQEANGFRADGEENAWRIHAGMYSPLARRAMTTETRGQNSWVNYGPKGEANRTAKSGDTVYADQKIGLLPAEFSAFPGEKLKFKHFSTGTEDQLDLDPEKMGTGAKGAEAKRGGPKVVSLYAEHGETEPEVANGRQRYNVEIPKEDLYDASADSAGLLRQAQVPYGMTTDKDGNTVPVGTRFDMNKFEELVRDAGYLGYHTPEASGILKGQARIFHKYPATREGAVQRQVTGAMRAMRVKRKSSEETVRGHLTPEENARLKKASARKLIEVFDELPAGAELAAAAVAGQAKRGWYRRSAEALSNVFGPDAPRFTALLAALSPQTSVEWNFRNAVAVWVGWEKAGRPTDRKKILFVMRDNLFPGSNRVGKSKVLGAWINNTVRALSAEDPSSVTLSGPKVDSFAANLRGETERVTLDAWMANWAGVSQNLFKGGMTKDPTNPGLRPGYLAFSARVREAAKILSDRTGETWTPSEVQETVWSWAKTLYEQAESFGALATARELVDNQELTDELINSTPDFAGQFADPEISAILRGTVYGPRAARSAGEAAATGRAAGKTAPADQDARYLRKAADRLDALRKTRKEAEDETRAEGATRVSTAPTKGIDAAALESVAARVKAELGVDAKTVNTQADLPGYVQDLIPEGATDVTGMFVEDQITGETEIWFIRENIDSKEEAYENALHETVGHMGLRAVLGKSYHKTMDGIRASFPAQVTSAARRNSIDMNHPDPATNRRLRSLAAEELVAYAAGRVLAKRGALSEQSVWRRIIAKVRDILRNVGLLNSYSNKDIEALIYRARDYFRKPAATRAQEISYRGKLAMAVKNQPDGAPQWLSPDEYTDLDGGDEQDNAARIVATEYEGQWYLDDLQEGAQLDEAGPFPTKEAAHKWIKRNRPEEWAKMQAKAESARKGAIPGEQITFSPNFDAELNPDNQEDPDILGMAEVKAFADGQQIGYVTLSVNSDGSEMVNDHGWTPTYVYVKPAYRGKGVAQRMYKAITDRLGVKPRQSRVQTPFGRSMWSSFKRRDVAFRMKEAQKQTDTDEFKNWFGDSQITDADGKPKPLFHGTFGDFEAFDPSVANYQSYAGPGLYFTDNPRDASENYADEDGPDVSYRVGNAYSEETYGDEYQAENQELINRRREIDRRLNEADNNGTYKQVRAELAQEMQVLGIAESALAERTTARARASLGFKNEGSVLPVFMRMEHPFHIGGNKETRINDETDELDDLYVALQEHGYDDAFMAARERIGRSGSISAPQLLDILKGAMEDDEHAIRNVLERMGFDGIIDSEVSRWHFTPGMTKHYVVWHAPQVKSSVGNRGTFDRHDPRVAFAFKQGPTGNTDLDAFINKIGASPLTLRQRWDNFKQDLKDRTNMGLFDEFHGIYRAGQLAGITVADSGYMDARLSKNAAELTQTIIENGPPIWDDGAPNIGTGLSLLDILKPLKGNTNLWLAYMTGRRADRLMSEGRENLFTPNEIAAALDLARQHPEFDIARQQYNQLQKQVLDFAEQAGVINAQGRALWEHADYIPFHRIVEGGQVKASASGGGGIGFVRNQIKRLTGGKQKIGDPLENIVRNWLSLMDASLKANAGRITVDALNGTGLVTPYKGAIPAAPVVPFSAARQYLAQNPQLAQTFSAIGLNPAALTPQAFAGLQQMVAQNGPAEDDVISVWRNGRREHWKVHDPLLMRSLQNIHSKAWAPIIKILTYPKRIVTKGITLTPQFALKNYWRDVWHVFVQGANSDGTKVTVLPTDSIRGLTSTLRNDATAKGLLAAGGSFTEGYVNPGDLSGASKVVRRSLNRATTAGKVLNTPTKVWRFYRDLQNAAENANRVAMYNKARAAGLSRKEAAFAARDLLDFSMRGNNPVVQLIVMSTPFMNARLQGLYRLGSGLAASKAMFISIAMRGMLITLASAALLARNFDDDRYKALTDQQKSNYWHFFDVFQKGDHFQLPKPFEVGSIFATIPEAIGDAMFTNSEEPDGTLQAAQLVGYTFGQTLNLSPQPQAVWPLLELAINKDTFTGSPILTQGDESVLPEDQRGPRSSASYAALAEAMPDVAPEALRSPKQLEHLGRGYLGNLQDYVLFASDALVREARGEPAAPEGATQDMPGLRDFYRTGPARNTRHVTAMYELAGEAAKIQASIKRNEDAETAEGDTRAEKLEEDNAPLLDVADDFKAASKEVTDLKKEQRQIQLDPDMTPAEKRKSIDEIQQEINDIAKDAYDLRPGGKLNPGAAADLLVAPPIARATILRKNNMPATADLLESLG